MHLSKMDSGRWLATVRYRGERRSVSGDTRAEAQFNGAELLRKMGSAPKQTSITVGELIEMWFAGAKLAGNYRSDCRRVVHRLPREFTRRQLSTVTPSVIEALYRQLLEEGLSPHRIKRAHTVLSAAWGLARRYEWAVANPFTAVHRPSLPPRKEPDPPTPEQVDMILAAADPRLLPYIAISSTIGARRGEVSALQWPDITDETINVRRALSYSPETGVVATEGKIGSKGHRVVAIDTKLASWLRALRVEQVELALAAGLPSPLWVFSHDAGQTPWRPDFVSREFARLRKKLGLPDNVILRELRHYVATQLLAAGVPLYIVSKRLGHSQLKTTSDTYGAFVPPADREAADIMANLRNKIS